MDAPSASGEVDRRSTGIEDAYSVAIDKVTTIIATSWEETTTTSYQANNYNCDKLRRNNNYELPRNNEETTIVAIRLRRNNVER
mgnify:CR=1 FL=1